MSRCVKASVFYHWSLPKDRNLAGGSDPVEYRIDGGQTREKRSFWRTTLSAEDIFLQDDHPTLVFLLTLLFALSSLAQFGSLSIFSPSIKHPETICGTVVLFRMTVFSDESLAFVVAWSGMSFQSAHYVGLLTLGLDLRNLGARSWECAIFWFWLCIGTGTFISLIFIWDLEFKQCVLR